MPVAFYLYIPQDGFPESGQFSPFPVLDCQKRINYLTLLFAGFWFPKLAFSISNISTGRLQDDSSSHLR